MKIQGEHFFQAPRDQVWEAVLDPKVLASSLPGFQRLDTIGDNEYEGALEIKVGPVQGDFQGTLKLSDLKPPSTYRFSLNGMGAAGFVDGDGVLVLEESGGGTRLHYDMDAKVGGRIAGVGQRLLDSSAKVMARQTLEGLERQFPGTRVKVMTRQEAASTGAGGIEGQAELDAEVGAPPATPVEAKTAAELPPSPTPADPARTASTLAKTAAVPEPPSRARFAFDFIKGLAGDLMPPKRRPWILGGALLAYTVIVILLTRACG